jgi:NAD(P)-dependent dehydrogenase (short-subunit alcohol dehydrogenase family)
MSERSILITGCSSGIGLASAREMKARGSRVWRRSGSQTFKLGPEAVAAKLVKALESRTPKPRYYVTVPTYVAAFLRRLLPTRALNAIAGSN